MSNILKIIIDYLKFLKPKAHNAITKLIVITGLALISPSIFIVIANQLLEKELKFKIISENDPYWGILLIIVALIYHLIFSKITIPSNEVLSIEFHNNSLWLNYEGTNRIEVFAIHLELFELSQKKEFRETQRFFWQIEKALKKNDKVELFSVDTAIHKVFDQFYAKIGLSRSHPLQSIGITITIHYNTIGIIRRKHIDFERWVTRSNGGDYIIHKHSYHYERNKLFTDRLIDKIKMVMKFVTSPLSEYRRISMMKMAQNKLDFESLFVAYQNKKITDTDFLNRLVKIGKKNSKTKNELLAFSKSKGFYEYLPNKINKYLSN